MTTSFRLPNYPKEELKRLEVTAEAPSLVAQLVPKTKETTHIIITRNAKTQNPICLEMTNGRTKCRVIPIQCQEWLGSGTILKAVKVKLENQIHYIFHDVIQVGGRNLFNATHREKFGALVSIMRAIECNANLEHWPKFALAPALPYTQHQPTNLFLKGLDYSTIYKNFQEKNIIYVKEQELLEQQKINKQTAKSEKRTISLGTNKPNVSASTQQSGAANQATNTATKPATKPETKPKRKNSKKKNNQRENVIIRPGKGGPDDYSGVSEDGKREGVVMVRTLALSLKLNKILRCEHFDLYRAPDQIRKVKSVKLPCKWNTNENYWEILEE